MKHRLFTILSALLLPCVVCACCGCGAIEVDRMSVFGQTVNIFLLFALALLTWVLPRRFGLLGMFGAQLLVAPGFLLMGFIALATGVWERHEDGLVIVGLLLQALFVNCLLFPVALVATLRHRRVASRAERGLCPGCGYDLRATPGRCPECGFVPEVRT